jgi:hypothetical protein
MRLLLFGIVVTVLSGSLVGIVRGPRLWTKGSMGSRWAAVGLVRGLGSDGTRRAGSSCALSSHLF